MVRLIGRASSPEKRATTMKGGGYGKEIIQQTKTKTKMTKGRKENKEVVVKKTLRAVAETLVPLGCGLDEWDMIHDCLKDWQNGEKSWSVKNKLSRLVENCGWCAKPVTTGTTKRDVLNGCFEPAFRHYLVCGACTKKDRDQKNSEQLKIKRKNQRMRNAKMNKFLFERS